MFSAVHSSLIYVYDKETGEPKIKNGAPEFEKNPDGGMNRVSIMGGELSKDEDNQFKHMSGFQEMYNNNRWDMINESNTTDGMLADRFRPLPGITSVSVEYAGSMKAIRNATISWTCFSFEDISRLTPHFLAHGKPIVLEWGWSSTKDMSDVKFMDIDKISDGSAYKTIQKRIWDNNGKYDAMAGLIKNFEWKTRDDGGFDCTTEITSMGVNTLLQQTKSESASTTQEASTVKLTDKEQAAKDKKEFRGIAVPTFEEFVGQLDKEIIALCTDDGWFGSTNFKKVNDQPAGLLYYKSDVEWGSNETFGPYLTWGWMEDNILSKFLGKINKPMGQEEQVFSDFRSLVPKIKNGRPDLNDLESVKISNHEDLLTTGPDEFIFVGQWPLENNIVKDGRIGLFENYKVTKDLAKTINQTRKDFLPFADPNDASKGYLRNIIIHWKTVKESFTGVTSIESGMQNLFNKLNAKFGIWNFKITTATIGRDGRVMVIDEHSTQHSIHDLITNISTLTNGKVDGLLYEFNVMNERSIVKSHNLVAKLPSSMQTAAMFGANNTGTSTTNVGNPGAVRLGKLSGQAKDDSVGEMNMAWNRPNFGTEESHNPNYNGGNLTLNEGPEIKIIPSEVADKDKSDEKADTTADDAKNAALQAQMLQDKIESVYRDSVELAKQGLIPKPSEHISTDSGGKEVKVFELEEENHRKLYNQYGFLQEIGDIKWAEVMKGVLTSGPDSSIAQRPLLIPLEIELEITGIGGIVPGNAFVSSYLPKMYKNWVAFQATDISHTIGTDGWTTSLKGLMRCAGSPKEKVKPKTEPIISDAEHREIQQDLYSPAIQEILGVSEDITPIPMAPKPPTPDPEKEKEKEAERMRKERDAANKKKKAEEERKKKEAERKKKEAEKRESKEKKQNKRKLKSTYKGTYKQNDKYLYMFKQSWRPSGAGGNKNKSLYGEAPTQPVPFKIRKDFWDNNIEPPNASGVSKKN
jgi:hypothetical protein